jgi:hypothetical protein
MRRAQEQTANSRLDSESASPSALYRAYRRLGSLLPSGNRQSDCLPR